MLTHRLLPQAVKKVYSACSLQDLPPRTLTGKVSHQLRLRWQKSVVKCYLAVIRAMSKASSVDVLITLKLSVRKEGKFKELQLYLFYMGQARPTQLHTSSDPNFLYALQRGASESKASKQGRANRHDNRCIKQYHIECRRTHAPCSAFKPSQPELWTSDSDEV